MTLQQAYSLIQNGQTVKVGSTLYSQCSALPANQTAWQAMLTANNIVEPTVEYAPVAAPTASVSSASTPAQVGLSNVSNDAQVKRSEMGAASGVATLGTDSKVSAAQLPVTTFPVTSVNGQTGAVNISVPTLPPVDGAANVASSRTLGTGPVQAAAGSHGHSVATAAADGFLSAAGLTKLNGLTAWLTVAYAYAMSTVAVSASSTATVSVPGATVGMAVMVTLPLADVQNMTAKAWVSAPDTVTLVVTAVSLLSAGTRIFQIRVFP